MPDLLYEKHPDRHYAIFTMNRPHRLNALGGTMAHELEEALLDFSNDPGMYAGVVTGAGRAFSAGADLKEMTERNARTAEIEARFETGEITPERRLEELRAIGRAGASRSVFGGSPFANCPKPIIAAINGPCIAGGFERSMDCDIRIASPEAYFGLYEVKRGILATYAMNHLARLIPFGEAMYLVLTGDTISAQEAHRIGYVHEVVPPERLMPRALEIAEMIAANAPLSVQGSKAVMQVWRQYGLAESLRTTEWVSRSVLASDDAKEGPRAFAEKRKAVWRGS
jgi:enoyl-CoA hydratase/carnithine racemase